jgi:dipeptidyl aminopeptidase/acylaminoacyl peptidase
LQTREFDKYFVKNMKKITCLALLLFAAFIYGSGQIANAQVVNIQTPSNTSNKQIPTIDEWFDFKYISTPQISPDGRYVAYRVRNTNWSANRYENKIEVLAIATGAKYELTDFGVNFGIEWMPDGKHIAFLSARKGAPQIYLVPATGGDTVQLTDLESGIGSFDISPDARGIAFTTTDTPAPEPKKDDRSGSFQIIGTPSSVMTHLWMIDLSNDFSKISMPTRLTGGSEFYVTSYSWSHDSRRIAFSGSKSGEIYSAFRGVDVKSWARNDIYTVGIDDKIVKKILGMKGSDFSPVWSPDDKQIAYMTSKIALGREFNFNGILYIAVVPAEGGAARILTEKFDETPGLIDWSPDGIYFSALQKTYNHLFKMNPATRSIQQISNPNPAIYNEFSFTSDYKQAAFTSESGESLPEVYVSSLQKFEPKRLTSQNDQLKNFKHSSREIIEWKSTDGTPIQGVLIKPDDFDSSKKYPLLVVIHTGPTLVDQPSLNPSGDIYPIEPLAAKGALVLQVNYRGSIGYGEKFRLQLVHSLGLPQYQDIISGVDYLISQGIVDRERVGALGYSHGGYIAAFIAAYSNRFKAVSVGAGVSDWRIFYTNSDAGPGMLDLLKATPWDDPDYYRETAPLTYIKKATTPTLIQHGRLDPRAPIAGSYELYRGLKDQGVPVKMIVYDGVAHAGWNPRQYRALKQHNYEWFSQWIWGEKPLP